MIKIDLWINSISELHFLIRKVVLFIEDLENLLKLIIKIENKLNDSDCFDEEETMLLKMINCECNYIVLLNDYTKMQKNKN